MTILADAILPIIPAFVLRAMLYIPSPSFRSLLHNRNLTAQVSTRLMNAKAETLKLGSESETDLLTVLGDSFSFYIAS